jgi:hypothetical protein
LWTSALGLAANGRKASASQGTGSKPLRGIFPIAQTPFTQSNQLDLDALVAEVRFIDRCRAHGFVWPQMATEWDDPDRS